MKSFLLAAASALALASVSPQLRAELSPTPLPGDARLVQFEYDADNTYLILARPKAVTHIEFSPDESILTVAAGDTKNWEITPTSSKRHLFVKPTFDLLETSMTVITDKRSYQFVLRSTTPGAKWYQRVTWRVPQTMLIDSALDPILSAVRDAAGRGGESRGAPSSTPLRRDESLDFPALRPETLSFGYKITGNAPFRPEAVFSDGKFTYLRLPTGIQELPALFGYGDDGELMLVNYIARENQIQVQRVLNSGLLRLGKSEVKFTRDSQPSTKWFGR